MMNSNLVFRSHLMQQFASAASSQVRPPIALAGTNAMKRASRNGKDSRDCSIRVKDITKTSGSTTDLIYFKNKKGFEEKDFSTSSRHQSIITKNIVGDDASKTRTESSTNQLIQDKTRSDDTLKKKNKYLLTRLQQEVRNNNNPSHHIESALDRAIIVCLQRYTQHGKFPLHLKRFSTESMIKKISDIAHKVIIYKNRAMMMMGTPPDDAEVIAQRKKWSKAMAYLVASVENNQPEQKTTCMESSSTVSPYSELPYVAPETELQLQVYGESCAAVQLLLGSLHNSQIKTKWITGPVTRTVAFRQLIGAQAKDRVVGLIMVG
mmetsp:Transcript_9174/g.13396  ORF Transcript_9174/g.13396 Transcript_9174/m.13396 type:complete len:321 (-) Transcript_9174:116-1078(-)